MTASVAQLEAKLLADSTDHRASLGTLEDLTKLAVSQQQAAHTSVTAEMGRLCESHTAAASARADPNGMISKDAHNQALQELADSLREEMAEMIGLHRLEVAAAQQVSGSHAMLTATWLLGMLTERLLVIAGGDGEHATRQQHEGSRTTAGRDLRRPAR